MQHEGMQYLEDALSSHLTQAIPGGMELPVNNDVPQGKQYMELHDKVNINLHGDHGRRDSGDNTALLALLMSDRGGRRRDGDDCCDGVAVKSALLQGVQDIRSDVPRTALETQIATLREINASKDFLAAQAERNHRDVMAALAKAELGDAEREARFLRDRLQERDFDHRFAQLAATNKADIVNFGTMLASANQSAVAVK